MEKHIRIVNAVKYSAELKLDILIAQHTVIHKTLFQRKMYEWFLFEINN